MGDVERERKRAKKRKKEGKRGRKEHIQGGEKEERWKEEVKGMKEI